MSHHYSGLDYGFPHGDARLDLTDLYAFPKPGDAAKSILIMNVHPSEGVNPPGPSTAVPFAPEAIYELKIDTDGDLVANIAFRVRFSLYEDGAQSATLRRVEGEQAAGTGDGGQTIIEGAPVSTGREARVTESGDYRFFAGWRSDPFFFDAMGALNNLQFTGADFFAVKDVCSIVLEVPNSALVPKKMGLWHRTMDGASGKWVQADRGALPSQSVFLTGDAKAANLAAQPAELLALVARCVREHMVLDAVELAAKIVRDAADRLRDMLDDGFEQSRSRRQPAAALDRVTRRFDGLQGMASAAHRARARRGSKPRRALCRQSAPLRLPAATAVPAPSAPSRRRH